MSISSVRVISFLWAIALVVTYNSSYLWIANTGDYWTAYPPLISALLLLWRPTSLRLLQASAVLFLISALHLMPALPNHRVVLLFVALTILVSSFGAASIGGVSPKLQATLRWLTLVVYFFAAIAKLNWSYLDPSASCATLFFRQSLLLHGLTPPANEPFGASQSVAAWWSSIAEIILLIGLLPRRTRRAAVLLGILFHITLATHYIKYFANFSAAMFVLLASWLPEESCQRLLQRYVEPRRKIFLLGACTSVVLLLAAAFQVISDHQFVILRHTLFVIFAGSFFLMTLICARPSSAYEPVGSPAVIIIIAACINGACPYLGIKTRTGFSMYSNLRIEPGYSNHLFMPASPDLLGYMRDTATITSMGAQNFADHPLQLPYISLCTTLAGMDHAVETGSTVSYQHHGVQHEGLVGSPLPSDCPSWIERKVFFYGPVGQGATAVCVW